MGDKIIGISAVTEVSMTRKAMNKHCTKVMLKSKAKGGVTKETTTTEESEMDPKIMKSFAGLQARTGTNGALYVAQLDEDKVKSFLEQDAEAQDAEVKTWADAEEKKKSEAAAAAAAEAEGDPKVKALETELAGLKETVKSLQAGGADAAIVEKAKAYPNVPNAVDVLKSVAGLTEEAQAPTLALLKAQNDLNAGVTARTIVDPATVEGTPANVLKSKVKAYAEANKVDENAALLAVTEDPANAELIQQVRDAEESVAA